MVRCGRPGCVCVTCGAFAGGAWLGSGACASNVPAESNAPKMNVAFVVYIRWILPSASIVLTGQWMCRHGDGRRVAVGQVADRSENAMRPKRMLPLSWTYVGFSLRRRSYLRASGCVDTEMAGELRWASWL